MICRRTFRLRNCSQATTTRTERRRPVGMTSTSLACTFGRREGGQTNVGQGLILNQRAGVIKYRIRDR